MEDRIIEKLIEHDGRLERIETNMFTKSDSRQMTDLLEGLTTICKRIDEDHTFGVEWIRRLQTQMERQEEEIQKIKLQLRMV